MSSSVTVPLCAVDTRQTHELAGIFGVERVNCVPVVVLVIAWLAMCVTPRELRSVPEFTLKVTLGDALPTRAARALTIRIASGARKMTIFSDAPGNSKAMVLLIGFLE